MQGHKAGLWICFSRPIFCRFPNFQPKIAFWVRPFFLCKKRLKLHTHSVFHSFASGGLSLLLFIFPTFPFALHQKWKTQRWHQHHRARASRVRSSPSAIVLLPPADRAPPVQLHPPAPLSTRNVLTARAVSALKVGLPLATIGHAEVKKLPKSSAAMPTTAAIRRTRNSRNRNQLQKK